MHQFGEVVGGQMRNNGLGCLAQDDWFKIPQHYSNVSLDAFTTMPNHLHGILVLHSPTRDFGKLEAKSLSSVIGN